MSRYAKPERCPEDNGAFKEIKTIWGIMRECQTCTVRQWCDFDGKARGTPANVFLRKYRQKAHVAFDRLWMLGKMNRSAAYKWLAKAMGKKFVHMAELTTLECDQVLKLAEAECKRLGL